MTKVSNRAWPEPDMPLHARRAGAVLRLRRAFTLIELVVVIAIISILMTIVTLAFRSTTQSAILAQTHNTLVSYAGLARSYAIANQIETMLVVNPYNGRMELWHANPPASGGVWDPSSSGLPNGTNFKDPRTDGFAYAKVFDSGAQLPVDGSGRPRIAVHPIDFYDFAAGSPLRPVTADSQERDIDNLTWAALCFDPSGRLVTRTRRIATRSFLRRDGTPRSNGTAPNTANRLPDGGPDLSVLTNTSINYGNRVLICGGNDGDTAITSTTGFVISDAERMRRALDLIRQGAGDSPTPVELVDGWLRHTLAPRSTDLDIDKNVADAADIVVFNRYSGQEVAVAH